MLIKNKANFKFLLLAIIWAGIIYSLSSIPDLKSNFDSTVDFILRKGAHIFAYLVLSYLLAKVFDQNTKIYLGFVAVVSILYAMSDEIHQLSVAHRSGSPRDILIDSVGVFLGILVYKWFKKR